jgi:peptide deformylase
MKGKILAITQLGQPVLRQKAEAVPEAHIPRLGALFDAMIATMKKTQGVGIAANQVGLAVRIFIVAPSPNKRYPHSPRQAPLPMINPRLLAHSKEMIEDWEGCLSVPGIRGMVPRYKWVKVEYTTRNGRRVRQTLRNFVARIFQHEFDHINGKVFLDRVRDTRTLMTDLEYARQRPYARR